MLQAKSNIEIKVSFWGPNHIKGSSEFFTKQSKRVRIILFNKKKKKKANDSNNNNNKTDPQKNQLRKNYQSQIKKHQLDSV